MDTRSFKNTSGEQQDSPQDRFWDFSLQYYTRNGVSDSLLFMQDTYALDVNIILLSLWAGVTSGLILHNEHFCQLDYASRDWKNSVIKPLRKIRKELHTHHISKDKLLPTIRKDIMELELNAEHHAQITLSKCLSKLPKITKSGNRYLASKVNLKQYFDYAGIEITKVVSNKQDFLVGRLRK